MLTIVTLLWMESGIGKLQVILLPVRILPERSHLPERIVLGVIVTIQPGLTRMVGPPLILPCFQPPPPHSPHLPPQSLMEDLQLFPGQLPMLHLARPAGIGLVRKLSPAVQFPPEHSPPIAPIT